MLQMNLHRFDLDSNRRGVLAFYLDLVSTDSLHVGLAVGFHLVD